MGGPLACNQPMRVRFPPLPPNLPGRPLRSRRQSEKLDKHVRLVPLAPGVTVAEWLRRATVDRSTRVQFSPVTPFSLGGSQVGKASDFESDHAEVRILPSQPPFFHAGVVQRIRIPGYEPGDLEVQILPPAPFPGPSSKGQGTALRRLEFRFDPGRAGQIFTERRPTGEVPGCLPGLRRVRFSYAPPKFAAMWTSWLSHPSFKRVIAGSNTAIATIGLKLIRMSRRFLIARQRVRFSPGQPSSCRVAEQVQRSIVNREDVGSIPTPTAMPGSSAGRGDWSYKPAQLSSILSPGTNSGA